MRESWRLVGLATAPNSDTLPGNIVGMIAAMTESEPGVQNETSSDHTLGRPGPAVAKALAWQAAVRGRQAVWRFSLM